MHVVLNLDVQLILVLVLGLGLGLEVAIVLNIKLSQRRLMCVSQRWVTLFSILSYLR